MNKKPVDRSSDITDAENYGPWLAERLRQILEIHMDSFVAELGTEVAKWIIDDPDEVVLDFSRDPPWDCSGRPVATGRKLVEAIGLEGKISTFLEALTGEQRPSFLSGMGLFAESFEDLLCEKYQHLFSDRLVALLLADKSDPDVLAFVQWAEAVREREQDDPNSEEFGSLEEWVAYDDGSMFGVDVVNIIGIDAFRLPLERLMKFSVGEVLERWGTVARIELTREYKRKEEEWSKIEAELLHRAEIVGKWLPRFRLAVGGTNQFVRGDRKRVLQAFDRIGLVGEERREFVAGTFMWSNSLRQDLLN